MTLKLLEVVVEKLGREGIQRAMGLEWISGEVAQKLDQWKQDMDLDPLLQLPLLLLLQLAVQLALEQAINERDTEG